MSEHKLNPEPYDDDGLDEEKARPSASLTRRYSSCKFSSEEVNSIDGYWANKYGYIVYEDDRVLLHTGLRDSADGIYALFGRNPQKMQPWTLMEFAPARLIGNVERLPDYVLEPAMPENRLMFEMNLPEGAWDTLVPIANASIAANG